MATSVFFLNPFQVLEMCIGIPMQVQSTAPGYAVCVGRGEERRVSTALVGALGVSDWVLVFLNDVRERITAERAAEVNLVLDTIQAAMKGQGQSQAVQSTDWLGFGLPSQMDQTTLQVLIEGDR